MEAINIIFNKQKEFFYTNKTKNINYRINTLKKLKSIIKENEDKILDALNKDLNKSKFEAYATEIGVVYEEINLHIRKLKSWSKVEKVSTPISYFPAKSYIYKEPYGVTLIIGPFNYPFQLIFLPLIGAISAGNCSVIKPSENTTNTGLLIQDLINKNFDESYINVVNPLGSKETVSYLLDLKFDYIFFTGSVNVGKIVMEKASKNLIPVTLELGGKSPCIVDKDSKLNLAAKRIVWGKFLNAGQTCVAPDYILVHKEIKKDLIELLKKEIKLQYGENIDKNLNYPKVVNKASFNRLKNYLNDGDIIFGGNSNENNLYFEPTLLDNIKENSSIMKEEIFGPILPILEYSSLENTISFIRKNDKPLALYYFSENKQSIEYIINSISSGGVTINDTIIHVASSNLPFGGVGTSGIGKYHGKDSYLTFSNRKAVLKRSTLMEFPFRFPPYNDKKLNLLRKIMK